jgi:predicted dinucleotide-binding enzyme
LGRRWAQGGHAVAFATRDPQSAKVQALLQTAGPNARAMGLREAVADAEVVVLAMPWSVAEETIRAAGDLADKVIIDATNPLTVTLDLAVGFDISGGELVADWARGGRVVKAFNTTDAGNMANADYGGQKPTMPICGDDAAAKETVAGLVEALGFEALDAGPLTVARTLEPLTLLLIDLAYRQGLGSNIAFKLLRR